MVDSFCHCKLRENEDASVFFLQPFPLRLQLVLACKLQAVVSFCIYIFKDCPTSPVYRRLEMFPVILG